MPPIWPWNRLRLNDKDVRAILKCHYAESTLSSTMAAVFPPQEAASGMDRAITEWIEDGLKRFVGRSPDRKPWAEPFMTREMSQAAEVINSAIKGYGLSTSFKKS